MKLEQLMQALFLDMFGDPITNPKGWPTSKFVKLIKKIESGKSIKPAENEDADGLRVLKISAITRGKFKPEESRPLAEDYVPPQSHFVKKGDFLFGRANTIELVGAVAIFSQLKTWWIRSSQNHLPLSDGHPFYFPKTYHHLSEARYTLSPP